MEKSIQNETPKERTIEDKFRELPIGELIKIPISKIVRSDVDDGRKSYETGPIEVYMETKTWRPCILNGNHRLAEEVDRLSKEKGGYGNVNFDEETMEVKKVKKDVPW